ncbi:unnamed protein product [Litomosoides sigmodontis]|uniref:Protein CNPPD1 n=1 Tax=Litomosoides sigmodontis TaxID=42156 RepID=A0A3P6T5L4_LITSI|nr:unnamed protein product [Litomosoides sigmodontis]
MFQNVLELAMNYFDNHCPFDYMSVESTISISRHGCVDACTFLVAMVYLDRIRTTDKTCFEFSDPGELYLSTIIIASKYLHDVGQREYIYNDKWAALASMSLKRVNEVELNVLDAINWNTNVTNVEFLRLLEDVEVWIAKDSFKKRGFCTYNELAVLLWRINFISDCIKPLLLSLAAFAFVYSTAVILLLMFPKIAVSPNIQRSLIKNSECVLSVTSTSPNTTQQRKAIFSFLLGSFYEWCTYRDQHAFSSSVVLSSNTIHYSTGLIFQEMMYR